MYLCVYTVYVQTVHVRVSECVHVCWRVTLETFAGGGAEEWRRIEMKSNFM